MIERIEIDAILPAGSLSLEYLTGRGGARGFFSHGPDDLAGAHASRGRCSFPRDELVRLLLDYNTRIGSHARAIENIEKLGDEAAMCVITGQQCGLLGGPVYTFYKIATAIRLASRVESEFGAPVVPLFWLASDDHDFAEVNHAFVLGANGEIAKVQFTDGHERRPIGSLQVTEQIVRAYEAYFAQAGAGRFTEQARELFPSPGAGRFADWGARTWSGLLSHRGLAVVEPAVLRPISARFFSRALELHERIKIAIDDASARIRAAGYEPAVLSEQTGTLFMFDEGGKRVRVGNPSDRASDALRHPERYSADVLLRPLQADTVLPVVASVLGPGEISYHAYAGSLYELFELPQPLLFPRKSYTVVGGNERRMMERYGTNSREIVTGRLEAGSVLSRIASDADREIFDTALGMINDAFSGLIRHIEGIDPNLSRTHRQGADQARRALEKLRSRTFRSIMSRKGLSMRQLRSLCNAVLPLGLQQERVFPLPHFICAFGGSFVDAILDAGELDDFSHNVVVMEEQGNG